MEIENETLRERIARQLEIEADSRALGASRYQSSRPLPWRTATAKPNEEADLPPGRQLLKLAVEPTAKAIREFVDRIACGGAGAKAAAYEILSQIGAEEAAYLTGRVVVNAAASRLPLTKTAVAVADALIDHIEMANLRERNRSGFQGLLKSQKRKSSSRRRRDQTRNIMAKEGAAIDAPLKLRVQTGTKAIELFCEATDLFRIELTPHRRRALYVIRPTEAAQHWFDRQHARCELLEPIHMPMVIRPRRWRTPFWGGYLTKRPGLRLVKQWNPNYHSELRHVEMPEVYAAVNAVQETPWRINSTILAVMREVWDGGGSLGGLPRRDDLALPPLPHDMDTNEAAKRAWKREAANVHEANAMALSKRLAMAQRLWIAAKFEPEEAIYFPHELDFRGRIYPIPTGGPHPQADDSGKALIEFAYGKPIGDAGAWWLAIHIANLFGVDKVSFAERFQWTMDHTNALIDSADQPLDGSRFWTTADKPWQALAAAIEWAGYMREGPEYVSHVPVALDGSNSGLQHFSAMLRDPIGARAVNLAPSDRPQDIYAEVAAKAQALADQSADEAAIPWRDGAMNRKVAKRPCMTFCYSATRFGMQDMVSQTLREIDAENADTGRPPHLKGADNYAAAHWASYALYESISHTVVAASAAMAWLRQAAKIACQAGRPIWWTTPAGLPVLQMYRGKSEQRAKVYLKGRRVELVITPNDGKTLNSMAQVNGIAPNFVHSLDASHLMSVANRCRERGVYALAVVHDSFGTHAADAATLSMVLRETFVDQYEPDVLARFRDELIDQLPPEFAEKLPPLPPFGDFDIRSVLNAEYVFS